MHQEYNADIPAMKEISERQVRLQVEAISREQNPLVEIHMSSISDKNANFPECRE